MVSPAGVKLNKGWFIVGGRDGDRTVEQQMVGLEKVVSEASGKTVLDVGCAEGLISFEMAKAGARCYGVEVVPGHIAMANQLKRDLPCQFKVMDLNTADLSDLPDVDIVLMLAVLHKLKNPERVCAALADLARDLCVIRLPPSGPVIVDARSQNVPQDIEAVMIGRGFELEAVVDTTMGEWLGYFRRPRATISAPLAAQEPVSIKVADPEPTVDEPAAAATEAASSETKPLISETEAATGETDAPKSETEAPKTESAPDVAVMTTDATGASIEAGQPLFPAAEQTRGRRGRGEGKSR